MLSVSKAVIRSFKAFTAVSDSLFGNVMVRVVQAAVKAVMRTLKISFFRDSEASVLEPAWLVDWEDIVVVRVVETVVMRVV